MQEKPVIFVGDLQTARKWASANYREWCQGLSDQEIASLDHDVGTGYAAINGALRGYDEFLDHLGDVPAAVAPHIAHLTSALGCKTRQPILLYRGYVFRTLNLAWEAFYPDLSGFEFTDPGFVSTSLDQDVAQEFVAMRGEAAVFTTILADVGLPSLSIEEARGSFEDEILLNRDRKFRVISATMETGTREAVLEVF